MDHRCRKNQAHNHLGPGYEELIYHRALELPAHNLEFEWEVPVDEPMSYSIIIED